MSTRRWCVRVTEVEREDTNPNTDKTKLLEALHHAGVIFIVTTELPEIAGITFRRRVFDVEPPGQPADSRVWANATAAQFTQLGFDAVAVCGHPRDKTTPPTRKEVLDTLQRFAVNPQSTGG